MNGKKSQFFDTAFDVVADPNPQTDPIYLHTSGPDRLTDDLPTCRTGQQSTSRPVDFDRRARQTATAINNPLVALNAAADKLN